MNNRFYSFVGGTQGRWMVKSSTVIVGADWPKVAAINIIAENGASPADGVRWILNGVTSNERYVTHSEKQKLIAAQEPIGRPTSTLAALIPIRKSAAWWALSQDERRQIFEETSHHIAIGMDYLPEIARRLHHCRDLATPEPFDFLTYFEFRESDATAFNELVSRLRESHEWKYVDREVDIRMIR